MLYVDPSINIDNNPILREKVEAAVKSPKKGNNSKNNNKWLLLDAEHISTSQRCAKVSSP